MPPDGEGAEPSTSRRAAAGCARRPAPRLAAILFFACVLLPLLAAAPVRADSWNLPLRGTLQPDPAIRYGDVWGVGDLLLLATKDPYDNPANGLYVVDASRPDSLRLAGHLSTRAPSRDVMAVDTLCLLAFEPQAIEPPQPAVVIASIADPSAPRVLGTFRSDAVTLVHNLWFAPPYAYLACTSTGDLRILDVSDPSAPREVGSWSTGGAGRILHDVLVADTLAYLSYWGHGMVVLSVADPTAPRELGRFAYPGAQTHSVALSRDGRTAYVTDELFIQPFGTMHILDVSDPSAIREVGKWSCADARESIHHVVARGDLLYVAYYTCGVRVLDISDPTSPREVAFHDVDPPAAGAGGFWGAWPKEDDSGLIYASHISRGAFVFQHRVTRVLHAGGGGDFPTIQLAVEAAGPGDTVRVAPGLYPERVLMKGGLALVGAGIGRTVIDAGRFGRPLTLRGGDATTRIAGFTLRGGSTGGEGGGGLFLDGSDAVVESVEVFGNVTTGDGGGISARGGKPLLRALSVTANRAARGGGVAFATDPTVSGGTQQLEDCRILDNEAAGDPALGGGLWVSGLGEVSIIRGAIARNSAFRGGGVASREAQLLFHNVVLAWNAAAEDGGAWESDESFAVFENCVLADNRAPHGSAVFGTGALGGFADFLEAVVAGNVGSSAIGGPPASVFTYEHSDFYGNTGSLVDGNLPPPESSAGNLFEDPRFVNPEIGALDYLPGAGSALIDAGRPLPDQVDLDSTTQDIGIGGGPESGWIAPNFGPENRALGPLAYSRDDYQVRIDLYRCCDSYDAFDGIRLYRGPISPVPLEDSTFIDEDQYDYNDTTLTPADTLVFYRTVPVDSSGHAGSSSVSIAARPMNSPPIFDIRVDLLYQPDGGIDSIEVRASTDYPVVDYAFSWNGSTIEPTHESSDNQRWYYHLPTPNAQIIAIPRGVDRFGLEGADTLNASIALLPSGEQRTGSDVTGDFRFQFSRLVHDELILIKESAATSLPNGQEPIGPAYALDFLSQGEGLPDSVMVAIRGPNAIDTGEVIVASDWEPIYFPIRREITSAYRSAILPTVLLRNTEVFLAGQSTNAAYPDRIQVASPAPNPFTSSTSIRFQLDRHLADVSLSVYDVQGRLIRELLRGELPPGAFSISWDGTDADGQPAPPGHYFFRASALGQSFSRHVILVR